MKLSVLLAISFLPLSGWDKCSFVQKNPSLSSMQSEFSHLNLKNRVERFLSFLSDGKYKVVFLGMKEYPNLLSQMENPPFRLCYRGSLPVSDEPLVSLCGTRFPDLCAGQASYAFALEAGSNGVGIVTSHSRGIDRAALYACNDAHAKAYVCCDCGLSSPRIQNNELLEKVNLISPFEPDDAALKYRCLSRNVLTAGLSPHLIVIQAPEKSGALNCATNALDLGRDVYVHATGIRDRTVNEGSIRLYQEGAIAVEGYDQLARYIHFPCGNTVHATHDERSLYRYGNTWYSLSYDDQ